MASRLRHAAAIYRQRWKTDRPRVLESGNNVPSRCGKLRKRKTKQIRATAVGRNRRQCYSADRGSYDAQLGGFWRRAEVSPPVVHDFCIAISRRAASEDSDMSANTRGAMAETGGMNDQISAAAFIATAWTRSGSSRT
jgi:uncharacterized protein YyaL (SSP411 family)